MCYEYLTSLILHNDFDSIVIKSHQFKLIPFIIQVVNQENGIVPDLLDYCLPLASQHCLYSCVWYKTRKKQETEWF